jgi:transposase InsO family protein
VNVPGDLVQLDTLQIKLRNGTIRWQFSARDVICRQDQARAYQHPTSFSGSLFLEYLEHKFPFPIRAIQIDGGSEFKKHFEEACLRRGLMLFIIPVRSPKLQGHVERANRTHREEFYEVEDIGLTLEEHNKQVERWIVTHNTIRPHQSLDDLIPSEYFQRYLKEHKPGPTNLVTLFTSLTYCTARHKKE